MVAMTAPGSENVDGPIPRESIVAALGRILADPEFARNVNSSRFLKFVVEETLEGRGARLKGFTIATMALQRADNFNPQSSSIVRVQAMRLREQLEAYYSGAGAAETVRILLPRGGYQPEFRIQPGASAAEPAQTLPARAAALPWLATYGPMIALGLGLVLILVFVAIGRLRGVPAAAAPDVSLNRRPVVAIAPATRLGAAAGDEKLATPVLNLIESRLNGADYIIVRRLQAETEANPGADYQLTGVFAPSEQDRYEATFQLVRTADGEVIWSRRFDQIDARDSARGEALAASVATMVGDVSTGAIFADLRPRLARIPGPMRGFRCRLAGVDYLRERIEDKRAATRACLERELAYDPDDVGILTVLSSILITSYLDAFPEGAGAGDLQRALQLARRALEIAPQRANVQAAVFYARFYDGRFDDAFAAARIALGASPTSGLNLTRIGRGYITRGEYDQGIALLAPLSALEGGAPGGVTAFLALAHYMRGEMSEARQLVARSNATISPLGLTMRFLVCHRLHDEVPAANALQQLRDAYPGFAADIPAALDRYAFVDEIKTRLKADLAEAGVGASPSR